MRNLKALLKVARKKRMMEKSEQKEGEDEGVVICDDFIVDPGEICEGE